MTRHAPSINILVGSVQPACSCGELFDMTTDIDDAWFQWAEHAAGVQGVSVLEVWESEIAVWARYGRATSSAWRRSLANERIVELCRLRGLHIELNGARS